MNNCIRVALFIGSLKCPRVLERGQSGGRCRTETSMRRGFTDLKSITYYLRQNYKRVYRT